jgi:EAL domain-containing protein (putative c-di-GMP-specific phosphodiesterase class I)
MPIREISEAFAVDDIVPYFQPIIDLRSQHVWRYECLARLVTGNDKMFLPSEFLYLIERDKHVQALTESMFCQCASYFENINIPWNINISATDLLDEGLTTRLIAHLANYPNPERVSVEISASSALSNPKEVARFVEQNMQAGIGVFIDNVGTCPGNIKSLMKLPIRGIKLAGGLIRHYSQQGGVNEYVDYLLSMCEDNGVTVIAEHIENDMLLEQVTSLPIRYAQGYVFSPPAPNTQPH